MNAKISVPNPIFEAAKRLAQQLDISLSELYTLALANYVADHQTDIVTDRLNEVYEAGPSVLEPELVRLQIESLGSETL